MRVNLPNPPQGSSRFLYNLIAALTKIFTRVRPASGWKDITSSMYSARVATGKPPTWAAIVDGIYGWRFSATLENEYWISFHLPHDMDLTFVEPDGTVGPPKIYPHVHWTPEAGGTDTGTARFGFEWTYAKGYGIDSYGPTQTIYTEQAADGTELRSYISETSDAAALQSSDFEVDGVILMRVFRDAGHINDTLSDRIFITFTDVHYLSDGLETEERNRSTGSIPWTKQSIL